ncbi:hypothetical protein HGRIS_002146 [Hohenbuehelia grisea]|uniref:HhH-GPD domain-containing protein n=1 Tax=Hohenbuehelia grisea TaxID=104357 RepID=A0ABR3JJL5_9AGAR
MSVHSARITRSVTRSVSKLASGVTQTASATKTSVAKRKTETQSSKPAKKARTKASLPDDASVPAAILGSVPPRDVDALEDEPVPAVLSFRFEDARQHLINADERFEDLFNKLKCKPYEHLETVHPFQALVKSILGQQISWMAARSINHKFVRLYNLEMPEKHSDLSNDVSFPFPTAAQVAGTDLATLKTAGLSTRKAEYVQDLASRFADGRLSTQKLLNANDEELAEMLIEVRGIGRWTAVDMFAIFTLRRPDILPVGDLGVQRGVLRWFLSLHSPSHSFSISPNKVTGGESASIPAEDSPMTASQPETGLDSAVAEEGERASTPDVFSVPPGNPPQTPRKNGRSDDLPAMPPLFTPSINRTLTRMPSSPSAVTPLPSGLTVSELKSRLLGKKKIKGALLTPKEMEDLTVPWRPYRSLALFTPSQPTASTSPFPSIMSALLRRFNRHYAAFGVAALIVYLMLGNPQTFLSMTQDAAYVIRATDAASERVRVFPKTAVLSHAPGFTVIDNLYWHNRTFYFVTDQPWHIPPMRLVASLSTDRRTPAKGRVVARIKSIRLGPVSPEVREENQVGETISLQDAESQFGTAEVIEGPMIINNDDNFTAHYYHWIGETFLGAWRVWSNYAWRTGVPLPKIKRVAFTQQYSKDDAPPGSKPGKDIFNDKPGANIWFTEKFFPGVAWDTKAVWDQRAESNKVYRITTAVIADRAAGHSGPSSAFKPWGDVLRLPVAPDWLLNLRNRILSSYRGSTPLGMPLKPLVIYLQRQDSSRRLFEEDHDALVYELERLQRDGVADVSFEAFNSSMPFDEQVARIARATILVAVHGNGLTHSLWMTPTPRSAVFEFQPRTCTITDYSPLAIAAGIEHYLVHEDNFCKPLDCSKRHCEVSGGINTIMHLEPRVVTDEIRRILL